VSGNFAALAPLRAHDLPYTIDQSMNHDFLEWPNYPKYLKHCKVHNKQCIDTKMSDEPNVRI